MKTVIDSDNGSDMRWCPECKTVYGEKASVCPDCGKALTDRLPGSGKEGDTVKWEFLIEIYNEIEADIVIGLLEAGGIPTVKQYKGMGVLIKVYTGTARGVDLYVPEDRLEEARGLLEGEVYSGEGDE